jgi:hypothetical protein
VARILAVVPDLMLASRVAESLGASGHEVELVSSQPEATPPEVALMIADLDAGDPEALAAAGVPVLGFYSHVDVETRREAEAAGIDLVVPRSRMARELPALVEQLLQREGG